LKEKGEPGILPGSPQKINNYLMIFGGLAILVTCVTVDPLALRPRFSPGLLLSDIFFHSHSKAFQAI